jgi:hypothetical protein
MKWKSPILLIPEKKKEKKKNKKLKKEIYRYW